MSPEYLNRHIQWQSIESAPRDGGEILLCDDNYDHAFLIAHWDSRLSCWRTQSDSQGRFKHWADATHWAALWPPGAPRATTPKDRHEQ